MFGLKRLIQGCGLPITPLTRQWVSIELGVNSWLATQHLKQLVLEVFDPTKATTLRGRFDFEIDYRYYTAGDGALWIDAETVRTAILKTGSYPSQCSYRVLASTSVGAPSVAGWGTTTFRSTDGMSRHVVGTAMGGGSIGANVAYWKKN
jgi:hypothetical protein